MYHQDIGRTGWNPVEGTLAPMSVGPGKIGLIASATLDDQVDTEALVVDNQTIAGLGSHTVVYVATEGNTVYAIDGTSGVVLASRNLGPPVPTPLGCGNNGPNVGVNGTPTIDVQNQVLYIIAYVQADGPRYYLHALDPSTLADKAGSPVLVSASHARADGSTYTFDASVQRQRAALLQANGNVYAAFASFCDFQPGGSRGWVLGWNQSTLAPLAANELTNRLKSSPNNFFLSSVWMSGFGLSADAKGNIYFVTGNSDPSGTTFNGTQNLTESVVKMSSDLTTVLDSFTPADWGTLDRGDTDYGSGGILILPTQPSPTSNMAVAAGKEGRLYVFNTNALGRLQNPDIPTHVDIGACWCGPSYFRGADGVGRIVSSGGSTVQTWRVNSGNPPTLSFEASSAPLAGSGHDPGFFTTVSSVASSANSFVIWALGRPTSPNNQVILYAFNGTASGGTLPLLWQGVAGSWPNTGGNANLVPTVHSGKVYVASYRKLAIFGLVSYEPISCNVFDDGYQNMAGPSDAVFINSSGQACIPNGQASGTCRKWFGRCYTNATHVVVSLNVFDDGYQNMAGPSDAVFINGSGQACIPNGQADGTCRKWFGRGTASDGRNALCVVFGDGYTNPSLASDAVFINGSRQSCIPNGQANGTCQKWWGRCWVP
jgi:hypothetical protein